MDLGLVMMSRRAEGCRDRYITRLMLICGYHQNQGTFTRRIRCIPLRRAFYKINPLRASLSQQSTVPLEGLLRLQSQQLRRGVSVRNLRMPGN